MLRWVEWTGAALGMLGSLLLALRIPPVFGFACYLASSILLFKMAKALGLRGLVVQQGFFIATALLGLWNWFFGPLTLS